MEGIQFWDNAFNELAHVKDLLLTNEKHQRFDVKHSELIKDILWKKIIHSSN